MTAQRAATGAKIALILAVVLLISVILGPGLHGVAGFGAGAVGGLLLVYGLYEVFGPPGGTSQAPLPPEGGGRPAGASTRPAPSDADLLNAINLRVRSAGFASELVERIERLIDQLSEILPTLSGQFAGFELTWQMQQIASAYLPKLVNAYAALSDLERPQKRQDFEESLRELEEAAARTARALREQKTTEFENISRFLKLRFS
jgi:hypothetical protein